MTTRDKPTFYSKLLYRTTVVVIISYAGVRASKLSLKFEVTYAETVPVLLKFN